MIPSVTIVDYGSGNVLSVCRAIEQIGGKAVMSADPAAIASAERLILPGVGAFGDCVAGLTERGLIDPILSFAELGRPFLGICVGMQMLHDYSDEFGGAAGLGLIPGKVAQIPTQSPNGDGRKIPHIGWAALTPPPERENAWAGTIFSAIDPGEQVYFVHSFNAQPEDPQHVLATVRYDGFDVTAAVRRGNLTGTQFHPEKSGAAGLAVLSQFLAQ